MTSYCMQVDAFQEGRSICPVEMGRRIHSLPSSQNSRSIASSTLRTPISSIFLMPALRSILSRFAAGSTQRGPNAGSQDAFSNSRQPHLAVPTHDSCSLCSKSRALSSSSRKMCVLSKTTRPVRSMHSVNQRLPPSVPEPSGSSTGWVSLCPALPYRWDGRVPRNGCRPNLISDLQGCDRPIYHRLPSAS